MEIGFIICLRSRDEKDAEKLRSWYENNDKALAVMQEASQELLSRGLIVDTQIFHSAVQHQTLHALGEERRCPSVPAQRPLFRRTLFIERDDCFLFLDLDKDHMVVYNRKFTGRRDGEGVADETVGSFKIFLKDTVSSDNLIELR